MTTALIAGFLMAGAVYLILQREMLRVVLGFILLSQAANMILIAAGGTSRREQPFGAPTDIEATADPLPQAFVLTAIVIAFAITVFMLVLSVTGRDEDDTGDGTDAPDGRMDIDEPDEASTPAEEIS